MKVATAPAPLTAGLAWRGDGRIGGPASRCGPSRCASEKRFRKVPSPFTEGRRPTEDGPDQFLAVLVRREPQAAHDGTVELREVVLVGVGQPTAVQDVLAHGLQQRPGDGDAPLRVRRPAHEGLG